MSFDRVLPRPVALYDDPASRLLHRQTSSLLEHKIMTDRNRALPLQDMSFASGEAQRSKEPDSCSTALSQMQLSAVNREQMGQNGQLSASFTALSSRQNTPTLISVESANRDRSGSGSPSRPESARESASQFCLCQPDPKIPRPRNAFILYRQHYQAAVVAQNPGLANPEISKIIGEQWRALPAETKEEWKALAAAEKARHQQQYPDYRYQPRRFGRDGYARNGSMSTGNQIASTICNRCGGRLMNPPSTPHTPLTAAVPPMSSRSLDSMSPHPSSSRVNGNGSTKSDRRPAALHILNDSDRRMLHNQWREPETAPLDTKRRRLNGSPFQNIDGPDTEIYSLPSQQQTCVSRPGVAYFRSHADPSSNGHVHAAQQRQDSENYYDPSLTLPPLKADGTPSTRIQADTVMTIPVLNKIKVLAKISPPLSEQNSPQSRGIVIAVDGQDLTQVKVMLKYLGQLLMDDGKYIVRVFEGPDIVARKGSTSGEMGDATVDYLNVISAWHRISDEIIQFISSPRSSPQTANGSKSSSRTGSPQSGSTEMLSTGSSPSPPTTVPSTTATSPSPVPVALVPRYQLTTADAFACSIPINDRYEFLDHWQWMASLWRACIGPDVTVHIRECDREEIERHGSGNPVEVRLNEARTLIVRRLPDPTKDIEEKALKRVGFEIEDFLTR
ncbi:hypothetical protein UA08_04759 [Talaromyces atroroseus]|uniref:HMG box domain-containing protein n=1 Tax=Talaromyces atroroseus TaxID=1441469 RepID=A0A225AEQ8_TALAT|nr:hypothetical protein UA08_04759 [Talaromyces atroroseus]OKL59772.1 hypothetical protein UA08_04759 [Talaromyces atroroseus]